RHLADLNVNGKLDGKPVTEDDFEHVQADVVKTPTARPEVPVHVEPARTIVHEIASNAGDSLCRDAVDARLVGDLLSFGETGNLASEEEAIDTPSLSNEKPALDSDGDGIPDRWEIKHHLDPHDPEDAQTLNPRTGYSNLELYLNELTAPRHERELH